MFNIDYKDRRPIYEQLIESIKKSIINGFLTEDGQLPSVRQLAIEMAINPNTIQKAYTQLEKQGVIYSVKGRGSFVAKKQDCLINETSHELFQKLSTLLSTMKQLGITQDQLSQHIEDFYKGGKNND